MSDEKDGLGQTGKDGLDCFDQIKTFPDKVAAGGRLEDIRYQICMAGRAVEDPNDPTTMRGTNSFQMSGSPVLLVKATCNLIETLATAEGGAFSGQLMIGILEAMASAAKEISKQHEAKEIDEKFDALGGMEAKEGVADILKQLKERNKN